VFPLLLTVCFAGGPTTGSVRVVCSAGPLAFWLVVPPLSAGAGFARAEFAHELTAFAVCVLSGWV
jgi:hypothetical protein